MVLNINSMVLGGLLALATVSNAQAQQAAVIHNDLSEKSYVGALEDKVQELNVVIGDLHSKLKIVADRLEAAEKVNKAINACAAQNPPKVYAGSLKGCVEVKPAPCELCDQDLSSSSSSDLQKSDLIQPAISTAP